MRKVRDSSTRHTSKVAVDAHDQEYHSDPVQLSGKRVLQVSFKQRSAATKTAISWTRDSVCGNGEFAVELFTRPEFKPEYSWDNACIAQGAVNGPETVGLSCDFKSSKTADVLRKAFPGAPNWKTGEPFGLRAVGLMSFEEGSYRFASLADRSATLTVDGERLIHRVGTSSDRVWWSKPVTLAGPKTLAFEYLSVRFATEQEAEKTRKEAQHSAPRVELKWSKMVDCGKCSWRADYFAEENWEEDKFLSSKCLGSLDAEDGGYEQAAKAGAQRFKLALGAAPELGKKEKDWAPPPRCSSPPAATSRGRTTASGSSRRTGASSTWTAGRWSTARPARPGRSPSRRASAGPTWSP